MARTLMLLAFAASLCVAQDCGAQTPHAFLGSSVAGHAQKAIEIMKDDPSWVNKRDSNQQTPLHVAARNNQTEAVEWLLANGADVNAQAYNRFAPLHLTESPEIVKLILEKDPDLTLKSASGTPLQQAINDLRHYTDILSQGRVTKQEVDALRSIVEMYVEHLGDDIDIISAVRLGDLDKVKMIVAADPAAAHGEEHGPNPLREAAGWGQFEICMLLVEKHNVDVDDFDGGRGYPVIKSAMKYPEIVRYLIEKGADLDTRITWKGGRTGVWIIGDNATALHFAAQDGIPETIKILLDAGIDPLATAHDVTDEEDKQTALEVAAYFGRTDNAKAILEHPAFRDADAKMRQKVLDVSLAIGSYSSPYAYESQDRSELIDALITHGANVKTTDDEYSLMQIAVIDIHPSYEESNASIKKMVSVLIKHGAKLDVFSAIAIGDFDALSKLLEVEPKDANSYSIEGYPALHMAIKMNYPQAVKLLLNAKCDVEIKNKSESLGWDGETALLCATFWGHDKIAEMLIEAGADVNATAERQISPLHEAVSSGNIGVAKLLLENGADKQATDHEGKTPLDWASDRASREKFKKLFIESDETRDKN